MIRKQLELKNKRYQKRRRKHANSCLRAVIVKQQVKGFTIKKYIRKRVIKNHASLSRFRLFNIFSFRSRLYYERLNKIRKAIY